MVRRRGGELGYQLCMSVTEWGLQKVPSMVREKAAVLDYRPRKWALDSVVSWERSMAMHWVAESASPSRM